MVFFYVPFALAFCLLRRIDWTPRLTRDCLALLAGLAVLFALVGFVEYATKTIFLNPKLIAANADHTYFTVNSVFFDPNIFGRFLALVMILLGAVLLYARRQRTQLATLVVLAILWGGLVLTLSRSSLGALLVGLGALAALRWRVGRAVFVAAGVVAVAAAGGRDLADHVRTQPGVERRLERPSGPRVGGTRPVREPARCGATDRARSRPSTPRTTTGRARR